MKNIRKQYLFGIVELQVQGLILVTYCFASDHLIIVDPVFCLFSFFIIAIFVLKFVVVLHEFFELYSIAVSPVAIGCLFIMLLLTVFLTNHFSLLHLEFQPL